MTILNVPAMRRHFEGASWAPFIVLILLEVLFALSVLQSGGTGDAGSGPMRWLSEVRIHGLVEGYGVNPGDYPPLTRVFVLLISRFADFFGVDVFLTFKLSLLLAFVAATFCFWAWTLDITLTGLLATAFYLNGVGLVYIDTWYAPTLILSLWALQRRNTPVFSILFGISCLIKWQPLIIAPLLLIHAVSIPVGDSEEEDSLVKRWLYVSIPGLVVVIATVAYFTLPSVVTSIRTALSHSYLSGNALNFSWLLTYVAGVINPEKYDSVHNGVINYIHINPYLRWVRLTKLAFVFLYLGAVWRLDKVRPSFKGTLECVLAAYCAYFVFNIGVHENHLFIGTVIAAAAAAFSPDKRLRALVIVALSNLNLITFYGLWGSRPPFSRVVGIDITLVLASVNVLLFLYLYTDLVVRGRVPRTPDTSRA